MSVETRINKAIEEMTESFENTLSRKSNEAMRSYAQSRLIVVDILAKHTDGDGVIPASKAVVVTRDILQAEGAMYRDLRNYLHDTARLDAEKSIISLADVLIATIGVVALAEVLSIPYDVSKAGLDASTLVFYLTGMSVGGFATSLVNSMFTRKGDDGLNLLDRLRNLSSSLRIEISRTVREGIRGRLLATDIIRNLERRMNDFKWRVETIIETEFMFVQRNVVGKIAEFGENVGLIKAVRIVDFPHGDPKEHARHRCYIYARADDHGLGSGIYPVTTRKVRNPHPRCRSRLFYVMASRFQ